MPAASTAAPPAALALACVVAWLLRRHRASALIAAGGAWSALVLLAGARAVLGPQEQGLGVVGAGIEAGLRIDNVVTACGIAALAPAALLLTFRRWAAGQAALAALALGCAVLAMEASSLLMTAAALGAATTLLRVLFGFENRAWGQWAWFLAAGFALVGAGTLLQQAAGTSTYGAAPVGSLGAAATILVGLAAVTTTGLVWWRPWTSVDSEPRPGPAGAIAVATMLPAGFYLLLRALDLSGGRFASPAINSVAVGLGLAVAAGAAYRAQAAASRAAFLAEMTPAAAGVAVAAAGAGGAAGITAAVLALFAASAAVAVAGLVPCRDTRWFLAAAAVGCGLPPGLAFGAHLLSIQAVLELGAPASSLAPLALAGWVLLLGAAARAVRLPAGSETGSGAGAAVSVGAALFAGTAAGLVQALIAGPVAADLLGVRQVNLGAGGALVSPSGAWPALAAGLPLLAAGAVIAVIARRAPAELPPGGEMPGALIRLPGGGVTRAFAAARGLRIPESAGIPSAGAMQAAAERGGPVLWLAVVAAVAYAIFR